MATTKDLEEKLESLEREFQSLQEEIREIVRKMSSQHTNSVDSVRHLNEEFVQLKQGFDKLRNVELPNVLAGKDPDSTHVGRYE